MKLDRPQKNARGDGLLPMINIVFLLLIFLMMIGEISERSQVDINLAEAAIGEDVDEPLVVLIDADSEVYFRDGIGTQAVLGLLRSQLNTSSSNPPVSLKADAGADFALVLKFANSLRELGAKDVSLQVRAK
ncbi:MAG: biopolymer transporter ExbD [Pseudomonadota bacterium]